MPLNIILIPHILFNQWSVYIKNYNVKFFEFKSSKSIDNFEKKILNVAKLDFLDYTFDMKLNLEKL